MTYENEVALVKATALKSGCTENDLKTWKFQVDQALHRVGLANGEQVRRIALRCGKFVK